MKLMLDTFAHVGGGGGGGVMAPAMYRWTETL